jgi:hypothetical protein
MSVDIEHSSDIEQSEHITGFWYVKILRGCIVASLGENTSREATIHPLRILTYRNPVMCSDCSISELCSISTLIEVSF